jgi:hypothetical protein
VTVKFVSIIWIYKLDRMLRRIFGPKREEVPRSWKRLHNGDNLDVDGTIILEWTLRKEGGNLVTRFM